METAGRSLLLPVGGDRGESQAPVARRSLDGSALSAHVVLGRRHDDPRFTKVEVRSPRHQMHYSRVHTLDDLNEDVAGWLTEAYQVGVDA